MRFLGYQLIVNSLVWKNTNFHSRNSVALQTIRWGSLKARRLLSSCLNGAANWKTGQHCQLHSVHQYGLKNCSRERVEMRLLQEEVLKTWSLSRIQPFSLKTGVCGGKNKIAAAIVFWLDLQQELLLGIFVIPYSWCCYSPNRILGFFIVNLVFM